MRILFFSHAHGGHVARRPKQPKNLFLDPTIVARAERYAQQHGTTLSGLVGAYLAALPDEPPAAVVSPAVRRLYGLAAGSPAAGRAAHRAHLATKYGVA
jgi:hypothetical protein